MTDKFNPSKYPKHLGKRDEVTISHSRSGGYDSFTVIWYSKGKRHRKSKSNPADADAIAKEILKKIKTGTIDDLILTGQERNEYVRAKEHLRDSEASVDMACRDYAEATRILGGDYLMEAVRHYSRTHLKEFPGVLIDDAVKHWCRAKVKQGATPDYIKKSRINFNKIRSVFNCRLEDVTADEFIVFIDEHHGELAPASRNNIIECFKRLVNYSIKKQWIPRDHAFTLDGIEKYKSASAQKEVFTVEEMKLLLQNSRPEMLPFLSIGAFAGVRSSEIHQLDWSCINLDDNEIRIPESIAKTSQRAFKFSDNLRRWLLCKFRLRSDTQSD